MTMTIDDIIKKSFGKESIAADVEAYCIQEQTSPIAFLDTFTREIVIGYLAGRLSWLDCDSAMNALMGLMSTVYLEFPDYAYDAFLAFDAGEYYPQNSSLTPDEITRPLIIQLAAKYHTA